MSFSFTDCHIDYVRRDSSKKICKISQIIRINLCSGCEIKAVIEANYWKLGQIEEDAKLTPHYPQENSMACD